MHVSTTAGKNWSDAIMLPYPVRVMLFADETNGLAAGGDFQSHVGGVYATENGGRTWKM